MKSIFLFICFYFVIMSNYAQYKPHFIDIKMETANCINKPIQFKAVSDMPFIATYLWNFGDGSTSTDQNPHHIYSMPGTYQVSLIVTTANCGTDCSSQYIQIARSCCVYSVDYTSSTDFYENYTTPPGTTTWSSGLKRIEKTLTVAAGCILEINGSTTVEFGPFGKIVVERGNPIGGTLKISGNAILTSITNSFPSCRVMWHTERIGLLVCWRVTCTELAEVSISINK